MPGRREWPPKHRAVSQRIGIGNAPAPGPHRLLSEPGERGRTRGDATPPSSQSRSPISVSRLTPRRLASSEAATAGRATPKPVQNRQLARPMTMRRRFTVALGRGSDRARRRSRYGEIHTSAATTPTGPARTRRRCACGLGFWGNLPRIVYPMVRIYRRPDLNSDREPPGVRS